MLFPVPHCPVYLGVKKFHAAESSCTVLIGMYMSTYANWIKRQGKDNWRIPFSKEKREEDLIQWVDRMLKSYATTYHSHRKHNTSWVIYPRFEPQPFYIYCVLNYRNSPCLILFFLCVNFKAYLRPPFKVLGLFKIVERVNKENHL